MKRLQKIYVVLAMLLLSLPLLLTPFYPTTETTESAQQTPAPQLIRDGQPNTQLITDAGDWYSDHYAFRQQLITLNGMIHKTIFATSPVHQVILGRDGWYFYNETVDDYTGQSQLSQRELFALVHNLQLMQWSAQSQNAQFVLMVAPNKNSVYPEKMPDSYLKAEQKNIQIVQDALKAAGVNVCDVYAPLLEHKDETLYYLRDSHWNRKGSRLAYDTLMADLGLNPRPYATMGSETRDHKGDLDEILLPKGWTPEQEEYVDSNMTYTPKLEGDALMDSWIETENPQGAGSILLFRDSFGINLVPFLADTFQKGWFSRLEPYNFVQIASLQPQIVAIEKTERRIHQFVESAPILYLPSVSIEPSMQADGTCELTIEESGDFIRISGTVTSDALQPETELYLRIKEASGQVTTTCALFYLCGESSEYGFGAYLPRSIADHANYELLIKNSQDVFPLSAQISGKEMN